MCAGRLLRPIDDDEDNRMAIVFTVTEVGYCNNEVITVNPWVVAFDSMGAVRNQVRESASQFFYFIAPGQRGGAKLVVDRAVSLPDEEIKYLLENPGNSTAHIREEHSMTNGMLNGERITFLTWIIVAAKAEDKINGQ